MLRLFNLSGRWVTEGDGVAAHVVWFFEWLACDLDPCVPVVVHASRTQAHDENGLNSSSP
jgi:hypothetical protein